MDLSHALCFYLLVVIAVVAIIYKCRLTFGASLLLGLIIGQIVLNAVKGPPAIQQDGQLTSEVLFYYTIQVLTPLIAFCFLIGYLVRDRR
jgi:hypothetical protein